MEPNTPERIPESPVGRGAASAGSDTGVNPPPVPFNLAGPGYAAGSASTGQISTGDSPPAPPNLSRPMRSIKTCGALRAAKKKAAPIPSSSINPVQVPASPATRNSVSRDAAVKRAFGDDEEASERPMTLNRIPDLQTGLEAEHLEVDNATSLSEDQAVQYDFLSRISQQNRELGIAGPSLTTAGFNTPQQPQVNFPEQPLPPATFGRGLSGSITHTATAPANTTVGLFGPSPFPAARLSAATGLFGLGATPTTTNSNAANPFSTATKVPSVTMSSSISNITFADTGNNNARDIFRSTPNSFNARLGANGLSPGPSFVPSAQFDPWFPTSGIPAAFGAQTSSIATSSNGSAIAETGGPSPSIDTSAKFAADLPAADHPISSNYIQMRHFTDPQAPLAAYAVVEPVQTFNGVNSVAEDLSDTGVWGQSMRNFFQGEINVMDAATGRVSTSLYAGQQHSSTPPPRSHHDDEIMEDEDTNEGQQDPQMFSTANEYGYEVDMVQDFGNVNLENNEDLDDITASSATKTRSTTLTTNQNDTPQLDEQMEDGEGFGASAEDTEVAAEAAIVEQEEDTNVTARNFPVNQTLADAVKYTPAILETIPEEEESVMESFQAVHEAIIGDEDMPQLVENNNATSEQELSVEQQETTAALVNTEVAFAEEPVTTSIEIPEYVDTINLTRVENESEDVSVPSAIDGNLKPTENVPPGTTPEAGGDVLEPASETKEDTLPLLERGVLEGSVNDMHAASLSNTVDNKPSPPVESLIMLPVADSQKEEPCATLISPTDLSKPVTINDHGAFPEVTREQIWDNTAPILASEKRLSTSKDAATQSDPDPSSAVLKNWTMRLVKATTEARVFGVKVPEDYIEQSVEVLKSRLRRMTDERKSHAEELARRDADESKLKSDNEDLQHKLDDMSRELNNRDNRTRFAENEASAAVESMDSLKKELEGAESKIEHLNDEIAKQSAPLLEAIAEKRRKWKIEKTDLNEQVQQSSKELIDKVESLKAAHSDEIEKLKAAHVKDKEDLIKGHNSELGALERSKKRIYADKCDLESTMTRMSEEAVAAEKIASSIIEQMEWKAGVAERNAGLTRVPGSVSGYWLVQTRLPRPSPAIYIVYRKKRGVRWLSARPRRAQQPKPQSFKALDDGSGYEDAIFHDSERAGSQFLTDSSIINAQNFSTDNEEVGTEVLDSGDNYLSNDWSVVADNEPVANASDNTIATIIPGNDGDLPVSIESQASAPSVADPGSQLPWKTICAIFPLCFLIILFAFQPLTSPPASIQIELSNNQTIIAPLTIPMLPDTCPSWPPTLSGTYEEVCTDDQTPPNYMWQRSNSPIYDDANLHPSRRPLTRKQGWLNALPGLVIGFSIGGTAYAKRWI
ncbi:hypothetical protein VTL71DRAFT_3724 [Oculimacula yallundae]|uniref:Uncharacterized protein n=1 Tax=Oculimacula yallundae TaxID=86028 RepID=A0ABR4C4F7_9HELO